MTPEEAVQLVEKAGLREALDDAILMRFRVAAAVVLTEAGIEGDDALKIARQLIDAQPNYVSDT